MFRLPSPSSRAVHISAWVAYRNAHPSALEINCFEGIFHAGLGNRRSLASHNIKQEGTCTSVQAYAGTVGSFCSSSAHAEQYTIVVAPSVLGSTWVVANLCRQGGAESR